MGVPKVEVETESAGRYTDVDLETLHRLVGQMSSDNSYVIVHRGDKPGEFAQAAMPRDPDSRSTRGSFIVEFKDESGQQHQAKTKDAEKVRDALAGWAFDLVAWKDDLKWKRLKLSQAINLRGNCEIAERDGGWIAHFPLLDLTGTGPTEDEAMAELRTVLAETTNRDRERRQIFADWASQNLIEVSPDELARIQSQKLNPAQQERVNRSYADALRTREPRKRRGQPASG